MSKSDIFVLKTHRPRQLTTVHTLPLIVNNSIIKRIASNGRDEYCTKHYWKSVRASETHRIVCTPYVRSKYPNVVIRSRIVIYLIRFVGYLFVSNSTVFKRRTKQIRFFDISEIQRSLNTVIFRFVSCRSLYVNWPLTGKWYKLFRKYLRCSLSVCRGKRTTYRGVKNLKTGTTVDDDENKNNTIRLRLRLLYSNRTTANRTGGQRIWQLYGQRVRLRKQRLTLRRSRPTTSIDTTTVRRRPRISNVALRDDGSRTRSSRRPTVPATSAGPWISRKRFSRLPRT